MRDQKLSDGFPTDRLVREADQGTKDKSSTFFSHTHDDLEMGGRFAKQIPQNVVGATPVPSYPAAAPWSVDPCGTEPSLGVDVNEMQPTGEPHEIAKSLGEPSDTSADGDNSAARQLTKSPSRAGPSSYSRRRRI